MTIIGIILLAFAVLLELFSLVTGRWATGYNWVIVVVGGLILALQFRRRDVEIKRWMWVVMAILLLLMLVLRITKLP